VLKTAKQVFHFLPGVWKITRDIIPHTLHQSYKGVGYATFAVSPNTPELILYSEKVTFDGLESIIGTQKYKYKYDIMTSSLSKYFSDDRLFYILNISEHGMRGKHLCIQDTYSSEYIFRDDQFILTYFVKGRLKDYKIITKYTKTSHENIAGLSDNNESL